MFIVIAMLLIIKSPSATAAMKLSHCASGFGKLPTGTGKSGRSDTAVWSKSSLSGWGIRVQQRLANQHALGQYRRRIRVWRQYRRAFYHRRAEAGFQSRLYPAIKYPKTIQSGNSRSSERNKGLSDDLFLPVGLNIELLFLTARRSSEIYRESKWKALSF